MKQTKKVWEKPNLIVIGRGKPEESVLAACKEKQLSTPGPSTSNPCSKQAAECRVLLSS